MGVIQNLQAQVATLPAQNAAILAQVASPGTLALFPQKPKVPLLDKYIVVSQRFLKPMPVLLATLPLIPRNQGKVHH